MCYTKDIKTMTSEINSVLAKTKEDFFENEIYMTSFVNGISIGGDDYNTSTCISTDKYTLDFDIYDLPVRFLFLMWALGFKLEFKNKEKVKNKLKMFMEKNKK